jgi:5S rRNA maturation endonuclease (ribonuclease M5)
MSADHIEIVDISTLEPFHKGREEWRFNCFVCEEVRGKKDTDGKFYWNVAKQKGFCHKCHTAFYPENEEVEANEEYELKQASEFFSQKNDILSRYDNLEFPREISFDFPDVNDEDIQYLKARNPFLIPLRHVLGLRGWRGRDKGVILPFIYERKIVKFQTRFYIRKDWKRGKYYTLNGPKPPYSPMHILDTFKCIGEKEITLCEGVFDAIALAIMGFNNPLAVLGDTITPLQEYIIRRLVPYRIVVALDDWDRSMAVKKHLHKYIPSVEEVHIHCKWGMYKDPEEFLTHEIVKDKEFASMCKSAVIDWVKKGT